MKKFILPMTLIISGIMLQFVLVSSANSQLTLASKWVAGFDGEIVINESTTTYPYQVGKFEDNSTFVDRFRLVVTKNGEKLKEENTDGWIDRQPTASINTSLYPEFSGSNNTIFRILGNLYGQWYARRTRDCSVKFCYHALFVPNINKIKNSVNPGDIVKSTLTFRLLNNGVIAHEKSLTVTISSPVEMNFQWNNDVALNSNEIPGIHANVSEIPDISGKLERSAGTVPPGKRYQWRFETRESETDSWKSSVPADFMQIASPNSDAFPGQESHAGISNVYGSWFIDIGSDTVRDLKFTPDMDQINNLDVGSVITSQLRVTIGFCDKHSSGSITTCGAGANSGFDRILSSAIIAVRINGPLTLTISNANVFERNIGDERQKIRFDVTVAAAQKKDFTVRYYFEHVDTEISDFVGGVPSAAAQGTINFDINHGEGDTDATSTRTTESTTALTVENDASNEGDEAFRLVLSSTTLPGIVITTGTTPSHSATGTIRNDDYVFVEFQESDRDQSQLAGDGVFNFSIRIVNAVGVPVTAGVPEPFQVSWLFNNLRTVPDGFSKAEGDDFGENFDRSAIAFASRESSKSISIPIKADDDTGDEIFGIRLYEINGIAKTKNYVKLTTTDAKKNATAKILVQKVTLTKENTELDEIDEGASFAVVLTADPALTGNDTISVTTLEIDSDGFPGTFTTGTPVTLNSSNNSQSVEVTAANDRFYSNGGTLTVSLSASDGNYQVASGSSSINFIVIEEESVPKISLSKPETLVSLIEGASFNLKLTADPPVGGGHTITVSTISTTGFASTLALPDGTPADSVPMVGETATVSVTATDDETIGNGGMLTVSIGVPSGGVYRVGTPSSLDITVVDNDKPFLTWDTGSTGYIQAVPDGSYSSMYATFSRDASIMNDESSATQKIGIQAATDMAKGNPQDHSLTGGSPWNQSTSKFGTNAHYGNWYETGESTCNGKTCKYYRFDPNDSVINRLPDNTSVAITLSVSSGGFDLKLKVQISRPINVSLSKESNVTSVGEGQSFMVTLTASRQLSAGESISITTLEVDANGFAGTFTDGIPVTFDSTHNSRVIEVTATDDQVYSKGGTLTVNLSARSGHYGVVSGSSSVSVDVDDNEAVPKISLTADLPDGMTEIAEGGTYELTLTADPPFGGGHSAIVNTLSLVADSLPGKASLDDQGTLVDLSALSVTMDGGTATISVTADDNNYYSAGGSLIVEIADGTGYKAADAPANRAGVSVAENESVPTVSFSSPPTTANEGETVDLTLTANPPVGNGHTLTVNTLSITTARVQANFVGSYSTMGAEISEANPGMVSVMVTDDDYYSNGGSLTISIGNNMGHYTAGSVAIITVVEGELFPAISLSVSDTLTSVDEGSTFPLILTADPPVGGTHSISVTTLSVPDSSFDGTPLAGTGTTPLMIDGASATVMVRAEDNDTEDGPGTLTVNIAAGSEYRAGTPSTLDIMVNENDFTQTVVLTKKNSELASIEEGGIFVVVLRADPVLIGDKTIAIDGLFLGRNSFAADIALGAEGITPVMLSSTNNSQEVEVTATDDGFYSKGGRLTVSLSAGSNYSTVEGSKSQSVMVTDNESIPTVSVSAPSAAVEEGGTFELTLTADPRVGGNHTLTVDTLAFATGSLPGAFLDDYDTKGVVITDRTETVTVMAENNGFYSNGGSLIVSIANHEGGGYLASTSPDAGSVSVPVTEDEPVPTVNLSATSAPVDEGDKFTLTLTADPPVGGGHTLTINTLEIDPNGLSGAFEDNYNANGVEITESIATVEVTVSDNDSNSDQEHLTVTIGNHGKGEYKGGTSANVRVNDTDPVPASVISFKRDQFHNGNRHCNLKTNSSNNHLHCEVSENVGTLPIFLSMSDDTTRPVSVTAAARIPSTAELENYSPAVPAAKVGTHFRALTSALESEKTLNSETMELNFAIEILDNRNRDGNRGFVVEFTLPPNANAEFAGNAGNLKAFVTIADDEGATKPTVLVVADKLEIDEGESVLFIFRSDEDLSNVAISIEQKGEYVIWPVRNRLNLAAGRDTIRIHTIDDSVDGSNGSITVRILEGAGYAPSDSFGTARVEVRDNDTKRGQLYSVASEVITIILTEGTGGSSPPQGKTDPPVPEISIVALESRVNEGSPARFKVESSMAVDHRLTINLRIQRTSGMSGGDTTVSVAMEPGLRTAPLEVATHNDEFAGNDGRLTAMILEGEGYRVDSQGSASVIVSDELDRLTGLGHAVLPEIAASIGSNTLDATGSRIAQAFSEGAQTGLELAGGTSVTDILETGGLMINEGEIDWRTLLGNSSFSIGLFPEGSETSSATVWGIGNDYELSGNGIGHVRTWSGDALTGHFGIDAKIGQGVLAGLAVSAMQAEVEFGEKGETDTLLGLQTTGLHPYIGLETGDGGTQVRMTAGYGMSEMDIDSNRHSTNLLNGDFRTFGVEGRSRLHAGDVFPFEGRSSLKLIGESWLTEQYLNAVSGGSSPLRTVANQIRMAIEGTHVRTLAAGHSISPSISIGMRRDGRNGISALGYEIGSDFRYEAPHGFSIGASGMAVMSVPNRIHEWEMQSSMDYDAGNDGLGLLVSIQPAWGGTGAGERNFLWESDVVDFPGSSGVRSNGARIESEVGYGFALMNGEGKVYPYGGGSITEVNSNEVRLGSRFNVGRNISFEIEGSEGFGSSEDNSRNFLLNGNVSW